MIQEESVSIYGVPVYVNDDDNQSGDNLTIIEFETTLMSLDFAPDTTYPCPRRTLICGPKKNMGKQIIPQTH